jgi:hypothetical protein
MTSKLRDRQFGLRIAAAVIYAVAAVLAAVWVVRMANVIPAASIADFVLAMHFRLEAIEAGRWPEALMRMFEPFGGHIVAYTRALQLINYYAFDYSAEFVRISAIAALALAFLSVLWLALRTFGATVAGGALFAVGVYLLASPTIYTLLSWPDSIVPYYSVFILACLLMPPLGAAFRSAQPGWLKAVWAVLAIVAIVIGSGVGWSAVFVIPLLYLLSSGFVDRVLPRLRWRTSGTVAAAVAAGLVGAYILVMALFRSFEERFILDEALRGMELAASRMDVVLGYFFASMATGFALAPYTEIWAAGFIAFVIFCALVVVAAAQRRTSENAVWIALGLLGLASLAMTTLARWHFVIDRGLFIVPQYYGVFAAPFYLGLAGLAIQLFRTSQWRLRSGVAVAAAGLLSASGWALAARAPVYADALQTRVELGAAAPQGAALRNLALTQELSGVPNFVAMYHGRILPDFKVHGKYAAATADFVPSAEAFLAERWGDAAPQRLPAEAACGEAAGLGRTLVAAPDDRSTWSDEPEGDLTFIRFVGVARSPRDCAAPAAHVVAMTGDGRPLCVSRPSAINALTIPHWAKSADPAVSAAQFDFSCPLPEGVSATHPFIVAVAEPDAPGLYVLPFNDTPVDSVALAGRLTSDGAPERLVVNAEELPINEVRAGWMSAEAGREEGGRVILDGWAIDRIANRTADAIVVTADGEIVYAAPPLAPNPGVEADITMVDGRRAGFRLDVPAAQLYRPDGKPKVVRLFALTADRQALEVYYQPDFAFAADSAG